MAGDEPRVSPFESIRQSDDDGYEYWSARDLAKVLGYARWDKFKNAIEKAEIAWENSGQAVSDHFSHVGNKVRQTIAELGGTMPEDLPTPSESIQQLRRKEQRRLAQGGQLSLFADDER